MQTVHDLIVTFELIASQQFAAEWDNVGLLVGAADWPAHRIMLTIDLTTEVLAEAIDRKADAIIAYHPPIFEPMKTVTDDNEKQRIILESIRHGIAIYSPHTALDAAPGGVSDWLAEPFGTCISRPLEAHADIPWSERNKVVTMVPAESVEAVHMAMSEVGAGQIGFYSHCSFRLSGIGTFRARDGANPTIGETGRLETIEEIRLEMVCSTPLLGPVIEALRQAHPYEEPPIEIHPLKARPHGDIGQGRLLTLAEPLTMGLIIDRLKSHLGVEHLKVAECEDARETYQIIGLCPGAGGSLLDAAIQEEAELFLTGEMRHHDTLNALSRGCAVVLGGHTNTERSYLEVLKTRLEESFKESEIMIAESDRDPFTWT